MDADKFLNALEKLLKQSGVETAALPGVEPQIGHTLRTLLPVTEKGDKVLTEFMMAEYTDDVLLLQIYTTMIMEIGPGYDALKEAILEWNLMDPFGAFGIYPEERQLFHKYTYPVPADAEPDEMADEVYYITRLILNVIARRFPDAVKISGHE